MADKLIRARSRLMTLKPWYGHMAMSMRWKSSTMHWIKNPLERTMGVHFESSGIINALYYEPWVEQQSLEQLFGAVEHMVNHLVRLHTLRSSHKHPEVWNVATDMAVNGHKSDPHIGYSDYKQETIMPVEGMVYTPEDWTDTESAEYYYRTIVEEQEEQQNQEDQNQEEGQGSGQGSGQGGEGDQEQEGQGEGQGGQEEGQEEGGGGQGSGLSYQSGNHGGAGVDNHEIWDMSQISEDDARQIVKNMVNEASEKTQGDVPGNLAESIERLRKPIVKWRQVLRGIIGRNIGSQRKTWSRLHRRYGWGHKGISRHAAATCTVIVDTSGSINTAELEQFFAEIESIAYRAKVMVLQWDAAFQGFDKYRRGDWKNITANGRGGTDMAQPFHWIEENNQVGDLNILLTDGETRWPAPRKYPTAFVITQDSVPAPEWGETVWMDVEPSADDW